MKAALSARGFYLIFRIRPFYVSYNSIIFWPFRNLQRLHGVLLVTIIPSGGTMEAQQTTINDKREIFGWAMYDWANSAFSTTVGTVFLAPYLASLARSAAEKANTSTV